MAAHDTAGTCVLAVGHPARKACEVPVRVSEVRRHEVTVAVGGDGSRGDFEWHAPCNQLCMIRSEVVDLEHDLGERCCWRTLHDSQYEFDVLTVEKGECLCVCGELEAQRGRLELHCPTEVGDPENDPGYAHLAEASQRSSRACLT